MAVQTLARVQRGLETLYRVDTGVAVEDFVVDSALRDELAPTRRPKEQLFVLSDGGDEASLALFVDPSVLSNLAANDPTHRLDDRNLGDFLYAIEGVSHFIYAVWCARSERPVSQLELELQAEVDKYVTCLLANESSLPGLRERLFGDCAFDHDLDGDERARYRAANDNANRYAGFLERAFVATRRIPDMLGELRRFYRLGLAGKLSAIARVG